MTVDKVTYPLGTGSTTLDKVSTPSTETKLRTAKTTADATSSSGTADSVDFSNQARDLQETEKILRFALERLESFDEVRQEKLGEVRDRVDQNFYFDEDVDAAISERIFSNQEIAQVAKRHLEVKQHVETLNQMDSQAASEDVDLDKVRAIREKIASGYYNRPEVIEATADNLIETLS